MTVTRRALASALRVTTQQSQRAAVLLNAATRDAKGVAALAEAANASIADHELRLTTLEAPPDP